MTDFSQLSVYLGLTFMRTEDILRFQCEMSRRLDELAGTNILPRKPCEPLSPTFSSTSFDSFVSDTACASTSSQVSDSPPSSFSDSDDASSGYDSEDLPLNLLPRSTPSCKPVRRITIANAKRLTPEERARILAIFRDKRPRRQFPVHKNKRVLYQCRADFARDRPRRQGRFCPKNEQVE